MNGGAINGASNQNPAGHAGQRCAWLILALFWSVGIAYSLVVPPFETPDEPFHYGFARHIAQGNGLPVQDPANQGAWAQEGSQAPLYYLAAGWLTAGIDQTDFAAMAVRNPRANIGDPLYPGNKNFMLYSGRSQPLQGANLALHVGRWLSLLLGAVTLWSTWRLAVLAFPKQRVLPLLVMALVAAIPQFLFLSASLSNDNAVIAASTFSLFWLARLLVKPADVPVRRWEWVVLGAGLGVAALSKLQGLGLVPLSGLVVLFLAWRRRRWSLVLEATIWVGLPALTLAGWWFWRNIVLYGDWSGLSHLMEINGRRQSALTFAAFLPEFDGLRFSAWGLFGWFNILLPGWFYRLMDAVTLMGLAGALLYTLLRWRTRGRMNADARSLYVLLMLWLWMATMALLLLYWTSQATGSQGRLLFPAIAAFAVLLAAGIDFWLRRLPVAGRATVWGALLGVLGGMSVYALGWLLPHSYYALPPVEAVAPSAQPANITYGDRESIRLLAVEIGVERVQPGGAVPITLYWQAPGVLTHDYQLFLQLLDENGNEIANLTTHPGWGRNPTTFWRPNAIYADPYLLRVTNAVDGASPLAAQLYIGWIDPATEATTKLPLPAYAADAGAITPIVGRVVVEPSTVPDADELGLVPAGSEFGGVIRLSAAGVPAVWQAGQAGALPVDLLWEAVGTPATDYTVFVHLRSASGEQVTGFDRAPVGARFPTSVWRAGDRIHSRLDLAISTVPAIYDVWVGLYESGSGGALRLPVTDAAGLPVGDGQVRIGQVTVE